MPSIHDHKAGLQLPWKSQYQTLSKSYPVPLDHDIPWTIQRATKRRGRAVKQQDRAAPKLSDSVAQYFWVDDGSVRANLVSHAKSFLKSMTQL